MVWHWVLHYSGSDNVSGTWYGWWSGFGSIFADPWKIAILFSLLRHTNCHVKGCKRVLCHRDPAHGHPACRRHHGDRDKLGVNPHA